MGGERLGRAHAVVGVEHEEDRPVADERQLAEQGRVFGMTLDAARQAALLERGEQVLERRQLALGRLVAAARRLARLVDAALDELEVAEHELGLDELHVGPRVDGLAHVGDLGVGEHADHVRDGVDAADVGEEAVAEALAAAGALRQAGDVDDVDGRVDLARRLEHLVQAVETRVGDGDDAHVGLGRRVGVGGGRRVGVGEGVEQGRLADVGQADDAELHGRFSSLLVSRVSRRRERSASCRSHASRVGALDVGHRVLAAVPQAAVLAGRREAGVVRRPVGGGERRRGDVLEARTARRRWAPWRRRRAGPCRPGWCPAGCPGSRRR